LGFIPSIENWSTQVDYQIKLKEIKELKKVDISQEDIDIAKLQGRNIAEIKRERLKTEKKNLIYELNKKYGIKNKEDEEMPERPEGLPAIDKSKPEIRQEKLWDLLNGKGLIDTRPK
jgi:hypothetical protein